MKITANNGVFLGELTWEEGIFHINFGDREVTEYMLEEALRRIREVKRR